MRPLNDLNFYVLKGIDLMRLVLNYLNLRLEKRKRGLGERKNKKSLFFQ